MTGCHKWSEIRHKKDESMSNQDKYDGLDKTVDSRDYMVDHIVRHPLDEAIGKIDDLASMMTAQGLTIRQVSNKVPMDYTVIEDIVEESEFGISDEEYLKNTEVAPAKKPEDFYGIYSIHGRTMCDALQDMRAAVKAMSFGYMSGLIEEVQTMGNRMESALEDKKNLRHGAEYAKELKREIKELEEKRDALRADEKKLGSVVQQLKDSVSLASAPRSVKLDFTE